jgi:hypothetical protein
MNARWWPHTVLHTAALLAPAADRDRWLDEWRSELWYVPRAGELRFCLGAFRDALEMRREFPALTPWLASPLNCLAFLTLLAAVSLGLAAALAGPLEAHARIWRMPRRELPAECLVMLLFSCILLPIVRLATPRAPSVNPPRSWHSRVRAWLFLGLKILLVQPILLVGFVLVLIVGQAAPIAAQLGLLALWIGTLRWVLDDQQRRCPDCQRLLGGPVRIGVASRTFLEWYGGESSCSEGHGLLQTPEPCAAYSRSGQWLRLGSSWQALFPAASKGRHS